MREDAELSERETEKYENITKYYAAINFSKFSKNYFITYPEIEFEKLQTINLYDVSKDEFIISDENISSSYQIELSDDETVFLDFIKDANLGKFNNEIIEFILTTSLDKLPNMYLERLSILKQLLNSEFKFTAKSIRHKKIENLKAYQGILQTVWGYSDFRNLKVYNNIEKRNKVTVEISQAQIIDDIVNQAEIALRNENFRDVYITASTGAGKSLMFQIPALYLAKKYRNNKPLVIVVSPLIALMNDQVVSMKNHDIHNAATINGNTPPFEKEQIIKKVQDFEIDMLYLSPESLQARSDITQLIGERKIGLVIIDEAHIVTTWGKSFRADYWYLGIYLQKLRKEYKFPIVTFTATAIYGGREDMYVDTRDSLNLISPISYFGYVKRDDILMNVRHSMKEYEKGGERDYRKTKNLLALKHIQRANKLRQKSLLYFPTIRLLSDFYNFVSANAPELSKKIGKYYGSLSKEEKDAVLEGFKTGDLEFVLATKAFGMGVDISDITNVYHYAPTGNVIDYIQEVGPVARKHEKVAIGFGNIDYLPKDFNEVKKMQGMSAIKKTQILEVMQKILNIYKEKGNNRNLVVSPEDFRYIFVSGNEEDDNLENKIKTVMLMIEKDFSSPQKLGYSPFVARPRTLFGNELIFVTPELESKFLTSRLGKYFEKVQDIEGSFYTAVYDVSLTKIWERYYKKISYAQFKRAIFVIEEREKLEHNYIFKDLSFTTGIEIPFERTNSETIISNYNRILTVFEQFANQIRISGEYFNVKDLGDSLSKNLHIADKFKSRTFAQALINSAFEFSKLKSIKFIQERQGSEKTYKINQSADIFTNFILEQITAMYNPKSNYSNKNGFLTLYFSRNNSTVIQEKLIALGIGDSYNLLNYAVFGGNTPQIYIRMNSVYPLEKAIKQGNFYENNILSDVYFRHKLSMFMLQYLFTQEKDGKDSKEKLLNYSKFFWEIIEDYFLGKIPEEVERKLYE